MRVGKRLSRNHILIILTVAILLMLGLLFWAFSSKESQTVDKQSATNGESSNGATTASSTQLTEVSFREDLLLHYTFNQTGGTTVVDESGHGNDGVIVGA